MPAVRRAFDYEVPAALVADVRVGSVVRVPLHGRRVRGWVIAVGVEPPVGVALKPIAKVTGWGPPPEVVELCSWAASRWVGRTEQLLGTATAERAVPGLPAPRAVEGTARPPTGDPELVTDAWAAAERHGVATVRLPPDEDGYELVVAAAERGPALVAVPSVAAARRLGLRLRRAGDAVAVLPKDWAAARAGTTTIGARAAAFAPLPLPRAVVVLDEHDARFQEERSPTWHAREVLLERARRAGAPVLLVSPVPSLEAQVAGPVLAPSRARERGGWPVLDIVDLRREDPLRGRLVSERLSAVLRSDARVVCVLNRTGRARLLACRSCGELARCASCDAAVEQLGDEAELHCRRCDARRPMVCAACGSTALRIVRSGVRRAATDLAALVGEPVTELTGTSVAEGPIHRVVVGTEAALHHVERADVVAFLEFDQELLAPRYRATEEAMALLVLAGRLVGGRSAGGRVLVQTAVPDHEVLQAARLGDPSRLTAAEWSRRELLRLPPASPIAVVSGTAAAAFVERLGRPLGLEVSGPTSGGEWLVRAPDHDALAAALGAVERPGGRLRIAVDPMRL